MSELAKDVAWCDRDLATPMEALSSALLQSGGGPHASDWNWGGGRTRRHPISRLPLHEQMAFADPPVLRHRAEARTRADGPAAKLMVNQTSIANHVKARDVGMDGDHGDHVRRNSEEVALSLQMEVGRIDVMRMREWDSSRKVIASRMKKVCADNAVVWESARNPDDVHGKGQCWQVNLDPSTKSGGNGGNFEAVACDSHFLCYRRQRIRRPQKVHTATHESGYGCQLGYIARKGRQHGISRYSRQQHIHVELRRTSRTSFAPKAFLKCGMRQLQGRRGVRCIQEDKLYVLDWTMVPTGHLPPITTLCTTGNSNTVPINWLETTAIFSIAQKMEAARL